LQRWNTLNRSLVKTIMEIPELKEPELEIDRVPFLLYANKQFKEVLNYYVSKCPNIDTILSIISTVFDGYADLLLENPKLIKALIKYPVLFRHSLGTMTLAIFLAVRSHQFSLPLVKIIGLGALLHDIGFSKLYDCYSVDDYNDLPQGLFNTHVDFGYELVSSVPDIPNAVSNIVLLHHLWDLPAKSLDESTGEYRSYPWVFNGVPILPSAKNLSVGIVQCASRLDTMMHDENYTVEDGIKSIAYDGEDHYGKASIIVLETFGRFYGY